MRILFTLITLSCILVSCTPSLDKKLKEQMITNPVTQFEKDQNLILQHAIDNKLDVKSTQSGIYYVIEKAGSGGSPNSSNKVDAHYHGTLLDGKVFDSSVKRGQPLSFKLGQVIKGWQEAIPLLQKGGKGKFIIPSNLAYGERGAGKDIPPNTVLVFDIELIDFK